MKLIIATLLAVLPLASWAADAPAAASPEPAATAGPTASDPSAKLPPSRLIEGSEAVVEQAKEYVKTHPEPTPQVDASHQPLVLDARKCVEMALAQNPQAMVAQDEVNVVQARIGQAKAQWRPQVSARSGFQHSEYNEKEYNPVLKAFGLGSSGSSNGGMGGLSSIGLGLSGGGGTPGTAIARLATVTLLNQAASRFSKRIAEDMAPGDTPRSDQVTLKQVLYAGGQISAAVKASEYLAQSQEWQRDATMNQIEYEAKQAYYDCLLANALVLVADESVVTFERHLADAQQMFDVGMISGFEVLRAKTELGARQSDVVAAKNAELLALANLRRTLSIPQDQPLDLIGKLDWIPMDLSVEESVAFANEHRPELLALQKGIAAANEDIRRVKGQYKPQLAGTVQYTNTDDGGVAVPDGWTFTIGGEWELYAGGRRKAALVEAKAQMNKLNHQVEDIRRLIELEVRQARIQVENAIARTQSEQGNVDLGREGLRLAELRFQEGVGTQAETLDADLALTSAESKLAQALRDYAVAHAALNKALGSGWASESADSAVAAKSAAAK